MLLDTSTAYGKYSVQYCRKLQLPIQMQVSEKRKTFSEFFVLLLESASNFKHFEKGDDGHSSYVSEIQTVKNFTTPLCKKRRFGRRLDSRHVKVS